MNTLKIRELELGTGIPAVCIPNVGKTREEIISLTKKYKELPMDLMEWRSDWFEDVNDIRKVTEILAQIREILGNTPLLFTFRTRKEGGVREMDTESYISLNKAVAAARMADLIDVEIFTGDSIVADLIAFIHENHTRVVASNHDLTERPQNPTLYTGCARCRTWGQTSRRLPSCPRVRGMFSPSLPPRKRWPPTTQTGPLSLCPWQEPAVSAAWQVKCSAPV